MMIPENILIAAAIILTISILANACFIGLFVSQANMRRLIDEHFLDNKPDKIKAMERRVEESLKERRLDR